MKKLGPFLVGPFFMSSLRWWKDECTFFCIVSRILLIKATPLPCADILLFPWLGIPGHAMHSLPICSYQRLQIKTMLENVQVESFWHGSRTPFECSSEWLGIRREITCLAYASMTFDFHPLIGTNPLQVSICYLFWFLSEVFNGFLTRSRIQIIQGGPLGLEPPIDSGRFQTRLTSWAVHLSFFLSFL